MTFVIFSNKWHLKTWREWKYAPDDRIKFPLPKMFQNVSSYVPDLFYVFHRDISKQTYLKKIVTRIQSFTENVWSNPFHNAIMLIHIWRPVIKQLYQVVTITSVSVVVVYLKQYEHDTCKFSVDSKSKLYADVVS